MRRPARGRGIPGGGPLGGVPGPYGGAARPPAGGGRFYRPGSGPGFFGDGFSGPRPRPSVGRVSHTTFGPPPGACYVPPPPRSPVVVVHGAGDALGTGLAAAAVGATVSAAVGDSKGAAAFCIVGAVIAGIAAVVCFACFEFIP
jgi:hypothetical protein